ncbi:hypothetical protein [Longimicrobium sp.]|uniref:hypothetical protein n=1 Tax=Longimicrobium sp. TaxID=2029185 RepID=UPI002C4D06B8|nr:hypothetical protein [Longimicrobium sp.]HSU14093.1 hypothetical protein [Longimicrobium sp.]
MTNPPIPTPNRSILSRILAAGLVTGVVDGLFSSILVVAFYHGTFARLWQGVASVLLGPSAMEGGTRTTVIGLLMHSGVALGWSAVFVLLAERSGWIRGVLGSRFGALKVASLYGPFIWLVMSLVVIPLLTHRPPKVGFRWFVQLLGHIPFVALPIAVLAGRGSAEPVLQRDEAPTPVFQ